MIQDEICTYEVCELAKEKGFDWDCPMFFNPEGELKYGWAYDPMNSGLDMRDMLCHNSKLPLGFGAECTAPTQSLLQRWLREERGIIVEVFMDDDSNMPLTYNIHQYKDWNWECVCHHHGNYYAVTDWGLCLEDALAYSLKNLV